MPATRFQQVSFSIFMAFAMVYGMELYNQALMAGGLSTRLFLTPFMDIVPLMLAVIVLETLIGGRLAAGCSNVCSTPKEPPPCSTRFSGVHSPAGACAP